MQYTPSRPLSTTRGAHLVSVVLVVVLAEVIAGSTVSAGWVPGDQVLPTVAILGALLGAALALTRIVPWPIGVAVFLALTPFVVSFLVWPTVQSDYPGADISITNAVAKRSVVGDLADSAFFLYVLGMAVWFLSAWLAWCVIRWRQALLGLIPGAALLATNVLNYPDNQNAAVFLFLVLALFLMLWTSYTGSLRDAVGHGVPLSGDLRASFWTSGALAMTAVILIGLLAPPLSHVDRTVTVASGPIKAWAELLNRLNHPLTLAEGPAHGNSVGLATDVRLGGALRQTHGIVLTYTVDSTYTGPTYFRAVNAIQTTDGVWRYLPQEPLRAKLAGDQIPAFAEQYRDQSLAVFTMNVLRPPAAVPDGVFYPGELARVNRASIATESLPPSHANRFDTIDRLSSRGGGTTYQVTVTYSTATEPELRSAGTDYPFWVSPYRGLPGLAALPGSGLVASVSQSGNAASYRPVAVEEQIRKLAEQVTAGATNPYDKAQRIERFLRSTYTYTLGAPTPPANVDPLAYFLFKTKIGYCEYFASAMGDMMRSLGIPTRLVNGYSNGIYDPGSRRFVVREDDAHTWVEVYFPHYGWIPFEPTPDNTHAPIRRGGTASNSICRGETACDANDAVRQGLTGGKAPGQHPAAGGPGKTGHTTRGGFSLPRLPSLPVSPFLAALIVLVALLTVGAARFLRPQSVGQVWRRTGALSRLAGAVVPEGETPLQLGNRLALAFPEAAEPFQRLGSDFNVAAYAPSGLAQRRRDSVMSTWEELRPILLRRIVRRVLRRP